MKSVGVDVLIARQPGPARDTLHDVLRGRRGVASAVLQRGQMGGHAGLTGRLVREIRLTGPGRRWQVHIHGTGASRLCLLEREHEVEEAIYGSSYLVNPEPLK